MKTTSLAEVKFGQSPLDLIEEIVEGNDWPYDRHSDEELLAGVTGSWCDWRLYFWWRSEAQCLHFTCGFDARIPPTRRAELNELLTLVNEKLWLGHFTLCPDEGMIAFRHTMPLRGVAMASREQIDDVILAAFAECERFYPAFQFTIWGGKSASEALDQSMFETVGEA
ncbi:MAG: YbjN domain-containing protein [Candidatus Symbiobacter sp.]|nr:YbjN domain-containing protein [Candidatus Symbiobacter sp.]